MSTRPKRSVKPIHYLLEQEEEQQPKKKSNPNRGESLEARIDEMQEEIESLEERRDEMQEEIDGLKLRVDKLESCTCCNCYLVGTNIHYY